MTEVCDRSAVDRQRDVRRVTEPGRRQIAELRQELHTHARQDADQQIAPDERIGEAAAEHASPRDQHVRRTPAQVGFERQIRNPGERPQQQALSHQQAQHRGHREQIKSKVCAKEAAGQAQQTDHETQTKRAVPISAPKADVSTHQQERADQHPHLDGQHDDGSARHAAGGARKEGLRTPRFENLEEDRHAAGRRCFDVDSDIGPVGIDAIPRRPSVGVHRRRPPRRRQREPRRIETGLLEYAGPVRRFPVRRGVEPRRHGHQLMEAAAEVEHHGDHSGAPQRRLQQRHLATQREPIGRQGLRTLAIPERESRRLSRSQMVPPCHGFIVISQIRDVVGSRKSVCRVARPLGVPSRLTIDDA